MNEKVIAHLARLGHLYFLLSDFRRADAFMKAIGTIKQLDADISEMVPGLMTKHEKLPFIGPSTVGEIVDVLQNGTSSRLERLEAEIQQRLPETPERVLVTAEGRIIWPEA